MKSNISNGSKVSREAGAIQCNFADSAFLHPSSIFAPRAFFEVAYTIVARGRTEGAEGGGPKEWLMIWDQVFDDRTHLIRRNGLVTDKTHISVDPPHRWKIPKLGRPSDLKLTQKIRIQLMIGIQGNW